MNGPVPAERENTEKTHLVLAGHAAKGPREISPQQVFRARFTTMDCIMDPVIYIQQMVDLFWFSRKGVRIVAREISRKG